LWRNTVKPEDTVIHLGDVIIGGYDKAKEILDSLPGNKILVMGNHDWSKSATWWMRNGFSFACHGMLWGRVWLSHYPVDFLPQYAKINIHGHCHINRRSWAGLNPFNKLFCLEYGLGGNVASAYSPVKLEKFVDSKKITELGGDYKHPLPW
jgi:calcineurin-like phosphoesterase family protein